MKYTHNKNSHDYPQLAAYENATVELNDPYCVSVALQFLAERFADTSIALVATVSAGYNSYMLLNIPADQLDNFIDNSGFDDFADTETNFITIDNDVYALYTDFSELAVNLEN